MSVEKKENLEPAEKVGHDGLFKWLLTLFYRDFFMHYMGLKITSEPISVEKEFIKKYPGLNDSLAADLLVMLGVEIDGESHRLVTLIEHKGQKKQVVAQLHEYACYSWLLWRCPIWSIALFTDDAKWEKTPEDQLWVGYSSEYGKRHFNCDIIKVNRERSADLLAEKNLFCCLLALKADDSGISREKIIREIFLAREAMRDRLTNDHKVLIEQFIIAYIV